MDLKRWAISPVWLWSFVLLLLAAALAILFNASLVGKLAVPPMYDDVSYFSKALEQLFTLRDQGIGAFIELLYHQGMHSLHSEVLSMLAYSFFGPYLISPHLLMIVGLLVIAFLWVRGTLGPLGGVSLLALGLFLLFPIATNLLLELRPDLVAWSATALGLYFYNRELPGYLSGGLIAYALLAKLTVAPLILMLCTLAFLLRVMRGEGNWRENILLTLTQSKQTIFVVLMFVAPFYFLNFDHFNGYFYNVVFGDQKEIWATQANYQQRLGFTIIGPAAQDVLGKLSYIVYPVILIQWIVLWRVDKPKYSTYSANIWLLLLAYAITAIASIQTRYLSALVPVMALLLFYDTLGYWFKKGYQKIVASVLTAMLIMLASQWHLPRAYWIYSQQEISFIHSAVQDLAKLAKQKGQTSKVYMPISAQLNRDVLAVEYGLLALRDGLPTITFRGSGWMGDLDRGRRVLSKYEYIFYPDEAYILARMSKNLNFPGHRQAMRQVIYTELEQSGKFDLVKSYTMSAGTIKLYHLRQADQ